jgi:hypothetical protein
VSAGFEYHRDCLTQEEKQTIDEVIRDDLAYDLGMVEKAEQ